MSQKRKDHKGRTLKIGESQRKDGRYVYNIRMLMGNNNLYMHGN